MNYSLVVSLSVLPFFALGCAANTDGQATTEQAQKACGDDGDCSGGEDTSDAGTDTCDGSIRYSGHAEGLRARTLLVNADIADTGFLPSVGGERNKYVAKLDLPPSFYADILNATVKAGNGRSYAESDVLRLRLGPVWGGVELDVLKAESFAQCDGGEPRVWGQSALVGLRVDGHTVEILGNPNQVVDVPGIARIVLNEQIKKIQGNYGRVTTNGLHITLFDSEDLIVSGTEADITCGCPEAASDNGTY